MSSDVVRDASLALKQAKNTSVTLKMRPIPGIERRMVAFTDSSRDASGNERHQKLYLICATNFGQNHGENTPISSLLWRSRKHTYKARSPLQRETFAVSDCCAETAFVIMKLESLTYPDYLTLAQMIFLGTLLTFMQKVFCGSTCALSVSALP